MSTASTRTKSVVAALAAMAASLIAVPAAGASFHLDRIRQVHDAGTTGGDYVELQLTAAGENFVGGHYLVSYDSGGNPFQTFQFPANVPNGQSQRTILISDGGPVGTTPDFTAPMNFVVGPAGSVCYLTALPSDGLDCVSYGATVAPKTAPSPAGTPALFVGAGLQPGQTLERTISRGCPTALDLADDTNDSAADFALSTSAPRNNAATPTETLCGQKRRKCKRKHKKSGGTTYAAKHHKCKKRHHSVL